MSGGAEEMGRREGVTDIVKVVALKKTDIGIMSDRFPGELGKIPQKNPAVELLQQLI